ncbi:hypothetical protein [Pseudomonas sp. RIT-To-2]|uniref:hypothetical protein n=1 Tax=Pseudomonas sp. RIT-To-2 TaxID=3462541 RepID=UPI002413C63E
MKSIATRTNVTTCKATVPDREITEAQCKILAEQQGLILDSASGRYRGYHKSEDSSTGYRHSWQIKVTVDHSLEAGHRQCEVTHETHIAQGLEGGHGQYR